VSHSFEFHGRERRLNNKPGLPATDYFAERTLSGFSTAQQDPPTPTFLRIISSGQKLVNEDCTRLNPTNAVNQSQYGL